MITDVNVHLSRWSTRRLPYDGIEKLLRQASRERILVGSHFPFFQLEAALLKLRESALAGVQTEAITTRNAARLLETMQC